MFAKSLLMKFTKLLCVWIALLLLLFLLYDNGRTNFYDNLFTQVAEPSYEIPPEPNATAEIRALMAELPNIPFDYWARHDHQQMQLSPTCAHRPNLLFNTYHNNYWQTFRVGKATFQLFGAYYDNRPSLKKGPVVRILAMGSSYRLKLQQSFCQLWFDEETKPLIVRLKAYQSFWEKNWTTPSNELYPHLLRCDLSADHGSLVPKAVSLVRKMCDTADNNLRVTFELPPANTRKQDFAVCVKGMHFPNMDISVRLIEWLEVMRLLSVHKVYIYVFSVHPNLRKVLDYYVGLDFVEVLPITLATAGPNLPHFQHFVMKKQNFIKRLNEMIQYNDCFYRNMYKYNYITLLDVDEVIMPVGNLTTWQELLDIAYQRQKNDTKECPFGGYSGVCFPNAHFSAHETDLAINYVSAQGGVSKAFYMLNHVAREHHEAPRNAVKCFHNTTQVQALHNHYPLYYSYCAPIDLDKDQGHVQHYRITPNPQEGELILDATIWRFKDKLVEAANKVFRDLGFLQ